APPTIASLAGADTARGLGLFVQHCARCHSGRGTAPRSAYPDLHRLTDSTHARFEDIVLRGALKDGGMASFGDILSAEDARNIHAFLLSAQAGLRAEEQRARR
ncbi:MAG: cytochrome c, partial [Gemmatimonadetes bacterium]|nr:cytochrome c [Gemmatimonadota bacterium]